MEETMATSSSMKIDLGDITCNVSEELPVKANSDATLAESNLNTAIDPGKVTPCDIKSPAISCQQGGVNDSGSSGVTAAVKRKADFPVYTKQMICKKGKLYAADVSELKEKAVDSKSRPLLDLTNVNKDHNADDKNIIDLTVIASTKANDVDNKIETANFVRFVNRDLSKSIDVKPLDLDGVAADRGIADVVSETVEAEHVCIDESVGDSADIVAELTATGDVGAGILQSPSVQKVDEAMGVGILQSPSVQKVDDTMGVGILQSRSEEKVDGTCASAVKLHLKKRKTIKKGWQHLKRSRRHGTGGSDTARDGKIGIKSRSKLGTRNRTAPAGAVKACYGCGWCKFRAMHSQTVLRHHFMKHGGREPDIVCLSKAGLPESELKPSIGFSCHDCDFSGRFRRELNVHHTKLHSNRDSPGGITDTDWDSQANPIYPHIYYNPSHPRNFDQLQDKYKLRDVVVQCCDIFQMGTDFLRDILIKNNVRKACVDILQEEEFVSMAYRHRNGVFLENLVKSPKLIGNKSEKQIAALVKAKPKYSGFYQYLPN